MSDYINAEKAAHEIEVLERSESAEQNGKHQAWERWPNESVKAHHAFSLYLNLAERRTFAKVAAMLGCSTTNVERWARRWSWVSRCYEHDLVEEEKWRAQASRDRLAHRQRQVRVGQALQSVAIAGLREWQARLEQKLPLNLRPDEVATLLRLGDEIEGRGLGQGEGTNRYTRIQVILGDAPPLPDLPAGSSPAVLLDDDVHAQRSLRT